MKKQKAKISKTGRHKIKDQVGKGAIDGVDDKDGDSSTMKTVLVRELDCFCLVVHGS